MHPAFRFSRQLPCGPSRSSTSFLGKFFSRRLSSLTGVFGAGLLALCLTAHAQPYTRIYGWGANGGQLGNNTTISTYVPTTADLYGKTITQLCMGGTHTVALTSDGLLYAWGGNAEGQLGNNSTTDTTTPVLVNMDSGVSSLHGKTIVSLAASGYCTFAVASDGTVHAWGWNGPIGMLGNNSTTRSLVPIQVDASGALAGKVITKVSGGRTHILAVASDGTLYAWGSNYNDNNSEVIGLLGNGSGAQYSRVPVAVTMTGALAGKTMTGVAAGGLHSLALASDGTVYGWGSNYNGPLGNGTTTKSMVPTAVNMSGAMAGKSIVALGAGYVHSVALASDGTAYGWGYGYGGRLGNGAGADSHLPVAVKMNGELAGKTLTAIATGTYNTMGLANDGTVYTWGTNFEGSLGVGDTGDRWEPTAVVTTSGVSALAGVTVTQLGNCTQAGAHFMVLGTSNVLGVPDAPTNLTTLSGNNQVTVSFKPPGSSGGSSIISYTVTASPGGATATGASSPITVTGLSNGTTYTFTVTATNSSGTSVSSTASAPITPPIPYVITTFAGSGIAGSTNATGTSAQLNLPRGIALDSAGNFYVADSANHSIRKVTSAGVVTTLAGSGGLGSTDATGTLASFNTPRAVAVDSSGNVYVADTGNHKIRKITSAGVVTTLAGSGSSGNTDATGTAASFRSPGGVAVDGSGNVFVADTENHKVRKITSAGVVTSFAGPSFGMGSHGDGTGTSAYFYYPTGITIDSSGNLYTSDVGSHTIRKITPGAVVTTIAGSPYSSGSTDATGSSAKFNYPTGIAVDSSGTLYVADQNNHKIRKVTNAGVVTSLAGSGSSGTADGTGTSAGFNTPHGIVVSPSGVLSITDYHNHKIRSGSLAPTPPQTSATTASGAVGTSFSHQITFSNTPTGFSATGLPSGLNINPSTGEITGTPTAGGLFVVGLTVTSAGGGATGELILTIAPGVQSISFGSLSDKAYGEAFTLSATATSGLSPTFSIVSGPATISGNTVTITGVGSVTVRASQAGDASYLAATAVDQSFAATKATATATLGSLAVTFDGTAKAASATTTPSGLSVDLTYNGSSTAPINAGSYTVVGTVNDSNYQGTVSGTLVIAQAAQTLTFGSFPATPTYGGSFTISATASSGLTPTFSIASGPASLSGSTVSFTGTGVVIIHANQAGNSNHLAAPTAAHTLTVAKATASVTLGGLAATFDGTAKNASATTTPSGLTVDRTYNGSSTAPTNAGSYTVVGTINDTNYQGTASDTLVIAKAAQTLTFGSMPTTATFGGTFTANATANSSLAPTYSIVSGPASLSGSTVTLTGVGTVIVRASQSGNSNYNAAASVDHSVTVSKATATVTLGSLSTTYNGTAKSATASTSPSGLTVALTYDGSSTAPTNAGSYAVAATINDSNYQGTASGTLVIAKAAQTITFGTVPTAAIHGGSLTVSATASSGLTPTFSIVSGLGSLSGSTVTLTGTGTVVIRASQTGNGNYNAATPVDHSVVVSKATASVTLGSLSTTYDGIAKSATASTSPSGLTVALTYEGSSTAPTNAGSYAVTATINDSNYQGTASGTLVIAKASQTIAFGTLPATTTVGVPFDVSAHASSGLAVSFSVVSGNANISGSTVTIHDNTGVVLRATQAGHSNLTAASVDANLSPLRLDQVIYFDTIFDTIVGSNPIPMVTFCTSGLPIVFTVSGPATISGNTLVLTGSAGRVVVYANQPGNGVYNPATTVERSFEVRDSITLTGTDQAPTDVSQASGYAGIYFGTFGAGPFALYLRADNTGIFLGYASETSYVSREVIVDESGRITFVPLAAAYRIAGAPTGSALRPAPGQETIEFGFIGRDGTLSGSIDGHAFSATKSVGAATQDVAGFYTASAADSATQILTIVGSDGRSFVWVESPQGVEAVLGSVTTTGQIVATLPSGQSLAVTVNASSDTVSANLTNTQGESIVFAGTATPGQSLTAIDERMVALSARAWVSRDHVAIVGFVISGDESKSVLIRAVGPALATLGVDGALSSPQLEIYRGSTVIAANTGWNKANNATEISAAIARTGVVAFAANSADSAVLTSLAPGVYTAVVSSATGNPGVALVEIYDLSNAAKGKNLSALSSRAFTGTGSDTLIAGVVIRGTGPKRVLIRAAGPSLGALGVSDTLAKPVLKLYSGSTQIGQNTGWSVGTDATRLAQTMTQVGAFAFPTGSADAAMLVDLAPGAYTAQVTGVNETFGVVLLEIYEVP